MIIQQYRYQPTQTAPAQGKETIGLSYVIGKTASRQAKRSINRTRLIIFYQTVHFISILNLRKRSREDMQE